ncbi:plasmid mobilization relaxosome protein MobC [Phaeobacter sp. JH20_24]|uniref:plasmid mobilization protein n=1 Tax=unclassified Phaeobacter TaxID=2621772 RepID=UPI003A8AD7F8
MTDDKRKKSGSENRERKNILAIRLTDAERAEVDAMAARAELTTASYGRSILLDSPAPRAVRRPAVDTVQVAKLLGELGKVGSNLNQLAYHLNSGTAEVSPQAIESALADVAELRKACMEALGRKA